MTRSATSLVGTELRDKLGSMVVRETPFSHDLWQVKIQSDLIRPEDDGSQVATIINQDGTFSFRREEPGYES
jgi:hypothetical protein